MKEERDTIQVRVERRGGRRGEERRRKKRRKGEGCGRGKGGGLVAMGWWGWVGCVAAVQRGSVTGGEGGVVGWRRPFLFPLCPAVGG